MFSILREEWVDMKVKMRYEISHAYQDENSFEDIVDVQELVIDDKTISIREEDTGLKTSLTPWDKDEGVSPGDIEKIHLLSETYR